MLDQSDDEFDFLAAYLEHYGMAALMPLLRDEPALGETSESELPMFGWDLEPPAEHQHWLAS